MIAYSKVMYVDVGFAEVMNEIESFFGTGLIYIDSIRDVIDDEWTDETLKVLKSVIESANLNDFDGDIMFQT